MIFGQSYLLDMYKCEPGVCDSLEIHYRFLEELVVRLDMHPMSPPHVMHGPARYNLNYRSKRDSIFTHMVHLGGDFASYTDNTYTRTEVYKDKAGVSAWQPLIESGIQIHSLEPFRFSSLDVYTCGEMNEKEIFDFAKSVFKFETFEARLTPRGVNYDGK